MVRLRKRRHLKWNLRLRRREEGRDKTFLTLPWSKMHPAKNDGMDFLTKESGSLRQQDLFLSGSQAGSSLWPQGV